ncbi:unnamed protein product, partial [Nesidiocoris tenuis]
MVHRPTIPRMNLKEILFTGAYNNVIFSDNATKGSENLSKSIRQFIGWFSFLDAGLFLLLSGEKIVDQLFEPNWWNGS